MFEIEDHVLLARFARGESEEAFAAHGAAQTDVVKAAMLEQLGLTLAPGQEDVDMLVMEKAR